MKTEWSCPAAALGLLLPLVSGCVATSWQPQESSTRRVQTVLVATSSPSANVYVNGRPMGETPLRIPLSYRALSTRSVRDVTLWKSDPTLAVALTLLTGGGYLPSSLFPVATERRVEASHFDGNVVQVRLEAFGLPSWDGSVALDGTPEQVLDVNLDSGALPGDSGS